MSPTLVKNVTIQRIVSAPWIVIYTNLSNYGLIRSQKINIISKLCDDNEEIPRPWAAGSTKMAINKQINKHPIKIVRNLLISIKILNSNFINKNNLPWESIAPSIIRPGSN